MISLKQRLRNGEQVLGNMVATFASPDIGKILKGCGFDFFIIDCEHGSFTTREVANIIAVARGAQIPALVRHPEIRREHALKFMEMGASGLLLPNTETAEQALHAGGLRQVRASGASRGVAVAAAYGLCQGQRRGVHAACQR